MCFGEVDGGKCLGEEEKGKCLGEEDERENGLGEDLGVRGEASLWDCAATAGGLLLAASPVAWMTLVCCLPSSSLVLGLWNSSVEDWGTPAG